MSRLTSSPRFLRGAVAAVALGFAAAHAPAETPLRQQLSKLPFKIAYESYVNDNWEIFVMNADGSNPVNLTRTPTEHEHYPQVSPDGTKLCFSVDAGEGREAVRSLYVANLDGSNRKKLVDNAREPFWSPDSKVIGFLPQEFPRFNVVDYYTKGMSFYDLTTGKTVPHPNSAKLHHLYNPSFAPNGKWVVATVHAGMGVDHGTMLIEARGEKIINLKIPGCRPCFSPDGRQLAWGPGELISIRICRRSPNRSSASETQKIRFITWIGHRTASFSVSAGGLTAKAISRNRGRFSPPAKLSGCMRLAGIFLPFPPVARG
jgi:Tol biopolymer transport system component